MQSLFRDRARAASLAALFFLYPVLVFNLWKVPYFETIHRITAMQTFNASVLGSPNNDSVAILILFFAFFVFSTRSRIYMAMMSIFATMIAILSIFFSNYFEPVRLAAAVTLPLLLLSIAFSWIAGRRRPRLVKSMVPRTLAGSLTIDVKKVAIYYMAIIIALETLALARWILYPLYPTEIYGDASWAAVKVETSLFHAFALLSPSMITLVAFSFLYRNYILTLLQRVFHPIGGSPESLLVMGPKAISRPAGMSKQQEETPMQQTAQPKPRHLRDILSRKMDYRCYLLAAVVASVLLVAYPHLPGINPDQHGVSTDEQYYLSWITHLRAEANAPAQLIHDAFVINDGDRPLTLLLLIGLSNLTGLPDLMIIRFIPLLLAPSLVVACYIFARTSFRANSSSNSASIAAGATATAAQKKRTAIIVGFLAVFSPQIVVGMYAGLLANWLALIAGFAALFFLARLWDYYSASRLSTMLLNASCLAGTMTLIMLFHAYSFWYFSAVFGVFVLVSFLHARKQAGKTILKACIILMALMPGILLDFSKPLFSEISPGIETQGAMVQKQFSLSNFNVRLENLSETVQTYVGGYLAAPLMWSLVLVWILKSRSTTALDRLILSMLFVMAIPLLFGSVEFQTRIMYNTPIQIPAALALLGGKNNNMLNLLTKERRLVTVAALAITANYAISAMANLYLVLPDGYGTSTPILLP